MIRMNWQDEPLEINRLVFRRGLSRSLDAAIDSLVTRLRLESAGDETDPRPGDFWIGCHPRSGWGEADPRLIGWASVVEAPLAVGLLQSVVTADFASTEQGQRLDSHRLVPGFVALASA